MPDIRRHWLTLPPASRSGSEESTYALVQIGCFSAILGCGYINRFPPLLATVLPGLKRQRHQYSKYMTAQISLTTSNHSKFIAVRQNVICRLSTKPLGTPHTYSGLQIPGPDLRILVSGAYLIGSEIILSLTRCNVGIICSLLFIQLTPGFSR